MSAGTNVRVPTLRSQHTLVHQGETNYLSIFRCREPDEGPRGAGRTIRFFRAKYIYLNVSTLSVILSTQSESRPGLV